MTPQQTVDTDNQTGDDATFPVDIENMEVGDEAGLIDFEAQEGYGRIAIKKTQAGESDLLKLQRLGDTHEPDYVDVEELANVGRWFMRSGIDWEDIDASV